MSEQSNAGPSDTVTIGDRRRWWLLGSLSVAMTMVMVDATILNVSVPQIGPELGARTSDVLWFNAMYSLVFAALLITMGRVGDRFGYRRLFVTGVLVFVAGSVGAALAQSAEQLIAARAGQGVGAAMFVPATLALVTLRFTGRERATAFAVWGGVIGVAAAIGPLFGGYIIEVASWRWAFGINVPIAMVTIAGVWWSTRGDGQKRGSAGFDLVGAALVSVAVALVVFGLIQGGSYGWWAAKGNPAVAGLDWPLATVSPVPVAFVLAALLTGLFIWWEKARATSGKPVVLDLTLFAIPAFTAGTLAGLVIMFGEFGMILTLPLFLQNVLGYNALQAGACVAVVTAGGLSGAVTSAPLVRRIGAWSVVRWGLVAEATAMVGLAWSYSPTTSAALLAPWLVLFGIGIGFTNAQLLNVTLAQVPPAASGQASATQSTTRQIGTALGVAVLGVVLWANVSTGLDAALKDPGPVRNEIESSIGAAIGSPDYDQPTIDDQFGQATGDTARTVFADATSTATLVGAGFVALALLAVARVKEPEPLVAPARTTVTAGSK